MKILSLVALVAAMITPLVIYGPTTEYDPDTWKWPWLVGTTLLAWSPIAILAFRERKIGLRSDSGNAAGWLFAIAICVSWFSNGLNWQIGFVPATGLLTGMLLYTAVVNAPATNTGFRWTAIGAIFGVLTLHAFAAMFLLPKTDSGIVGSQIHSNAAGEIASWGVPLLLACFYRANQVPIRVVLGAAVAVSAAYTFQTHSEGAWIAASAGVLLVLALGAFVFRARTPSRPPVLAAGLILLIVGAFAGSALETQDKTPTADVPTVEKPTLWTLQVRKDIWVASTDAFLENPLLGAGPGRFGAAFAPHRSAEEAALHHPSWSSPYPNPTLRRVDSAHNTFVHMAIELGLFGLAGLLMLILVNIYKVARLPRSRAATEENWLTFGFAAATLGLLVHGLVSDPLIRPGTIALFFIGLAGLERTGNLDARRVKRHIGEPRLAGLLCLFLGGILVLTIHIQRARAEDLLVQAYQAMTEEGNFTEGLEMTEAALLEWDKHPDTLLRAARAHLLNLRRLDPQSPDRQLSIDRADALLRLALDRDPNSPTIQREYGLFMITESGDIGEGTRHLEKTAELLPFSPVAWADLGFAYILSERYSDAVEAYRKALELNPDYRKAMFGRAQAHYQLGDVASAVAWLAELDQRGYTIPIVPATLANDQFLRGIENTPEFREAFR